MLDHPKIKIMVIFSVGKGVRADSWGDREWGRLSELKVGLSLSLQSHF